MRVKIINRVWGMSKGEYKNLLIVAKEQVSIGIYAVEKDNYAELRKDIFNSKKKLKNAVREFKQQGYKVYYNG